MFPHSFNKGFDEWIEGFVFDFTHDKTSSCTLSPESESKSVHL